MATIDLSSISNPLITSSQLLHYQQTRDSSINTPSALFAVSLLAQTAGILLRLPQEVVATAVVLLQRYWIVSSLQQAIHGGNIRYDPQTASAAALYLVAKQSFYQIAPRSVTNVYSYLTSKASTLWFVNPQSAGSDHDPEDFFVSEGRHEKERSRLLACENAILAAVGFDTDVALPHGLALTYMQALGVSSQKMAQRVFENLNGALLSPQLVYLTHQPNALAVAAIYLAAKEVGVKLVEENWWEVFDVDREDLGFLVLAFGSLKNFADAEKKQWEGKAIPIQC